MSWKTELSVHQPEDGRDQDHCDGDHGQAQRGGGGADRVHDGEPVRISFKSTSTKVKPKDWKLDR